MPTAGTPPPFATTAWLSPSPPLPVSATWKASTATLLVTFDQPIADRATWNLANWWYQDSPFTRFPANTVVRSAPAQVRMTNTSGVAPLAGSVGANYDPPPFQVRSLSDLPAAPFYGYPVTLI